MVSEDDMTEARELEPWEKAYYAEKRQLENYRGRRLRACVAADDLHAIIEQLGVENDPSILPIPDHVMPAAPPDAIKREMQNTVSNLLRLILLYNDGQVSPQKLQRW
jgi:hypothetical protein